MHASWRWSHSIIWECSKLGMDISFEVLMDRNSVMFVLANILKPTCPHLTHLHLFLSCLDTVILFVGSGKWPWKFWNGSLNKLYLLCCCHVKIAYRLEQHYYQTQQCTWEFVPALSVSSHRINKHQRAHTSHNTAVIDRWCDIPLLLLSSPKEKGSVFFISSIHSLIFLINYFWN